MKFRIITNLFITISLSFLLISCNGNKGPKSGVDHEAIEKELMQGLEATPEDKQKDLVQKREHAKFLIEKRSSEEQSYSMLTAFYYEWEFVFGGKKIEPAEPGTWFKFNDDFTYQYGQYDKIKGSGMYHFKLDEKQMMMRDDKETKMPQEWQVMVKEDVLVLVGKDYFSNNPKQIKTNKRMERPKKA